MSFKKDCDPPDGGGPPDENPFYVSQLMDTEDIGLIIRKIPNNIISNSTSNIAPNQPTIPAVVNQALDKSSLSGSTQTHVSNTCSTHVSPPSDNSSIKDSNKFLNKFGLSDPGPFLVILESITENVGNLHPMAIGKLLLQQHKELDNFIQSISNAGRNRIKITFKSAYHANILLNSKIIEQKQMKAFIPQYLTKRVGIIRGVDLSLTDDEIKNLIAPLSGQDFSVLEATRMNRRVIDDNKEITYKPTGTVRISFKGQRLPTCVSLCKVICEVEPYIQRVVQCFNCLRYGHVSAQCRAKVKCAKCGNEHKTSDCSTTDSPSCIFCKGEHLSSDHKTCPEFQKQKNIKTIMANENMSYRDAISKINNSFASAVQTPIRCTQEEFPSLFENRKRKKPIPIKNTLYTAENIHKDHTGNGVCLVSNPIDLVNEILPNLIEKLVTATMHMYKSKNLTPSQCESTIKDIIEPLINYKNH